MKAVDPNRMLSSLLLGTMLLCSPLFAHSDDSVEQNRNSDQVSVNWTDPEQFTETKYGRTFRQPSPEIWLGEFQKLVVKRAGAVLKPGQHLDVTITNVDLAGQVEPFHGSVATDVRVVKSIYPPEIDLTFTLTGADGQVLDRGERKLRDVAFLDRGSANHSDSYRFEKRLLTDWINKEFSKHSNP